MKIIGNIEIEENPMLRIAEILLCLVDEGATKTRKKELINELEEICVHVKQVRQQEAL